MKYSSLFPDSADHKAAYRTMEVEAKGNLPGFQRKQGTCLVKAYVFYGVKWSKLKENPLREVKRFKGEAKRVRFLMPEEVQTLISNCQDFLKPIVTVAGHTGG